MWRGNGCVPRLTGAEAVLCSAQGGAVAAVELRAAIQPLFHVKLHWKQEADLEILDLYPFLDAVLVYEGASGILTLNMIFVKEVW